MSELGGGGREMSATGLMRRLGLGGKDEQLSAVYECQPDGTRTEPSVDESILTC